MTTNITVVEKPASAIQKEFMLNTNDLSKFIDKNKARLEGEAENTQMFLGNIMATQELLADYIGQIKSLESLDKIEKALNTNANGLSIQTLSNDSIDNILENMQLDNINVAIKSLDEAGLKKYIKKLKQMLNFHSLEEDSSEDALKALSNIEKQTGSKSTLLSHEVQIPEKVSVANMHEVKTFVLSMLPAITQDMKILEKMLVNWLDDSVTYMDYCKKTQAEIKTLNKVMKERFAIESTSELMSLSAVEQLYKKVQSLPVTDLEHKNAIRLKELLDADIPAQLHAAEDQAWLVPTAYMPAILMMLETDIVQNQSKLTELIKDALDIELEPSLYTYKMPEDVKAHLQSGDIFTGGDGKPIEVVD